MKAVATRKRKPAVSSRAASGSSRSRRGA
jgi:hypothetical protein